MFQSSHNNEGGKKKRGQDIVHVSSLFAKYAKLIRAPQGSVIQASIEAIKHLYGVTVSKTDLAYQVHSKTLVLHVRGPIKSEILFNKENFLKEIAGRIGAENAPKHIL